MFKDHLEIIKKNKFVGPFSLNRTLQQKKKLPNFTCSIALGNLSHILYSINGTQRVRAAEKTEQKKIKVFPGLLRNLFKDNVFINNFSKETIIFADIKVSVVTYYIESQFYDIYFLSMLLYKQQQK